jgi:ATP-binding cassette subfamily A (ABC1) protein 3
MGTIITFGGPILYLVIYGLILLAILVWVDSGSIFPRRLSASRQQQILSHLQDGQASCSEAKKDVAAEAKSVSVSNDLLRVLHITKSFSGNKVVDDVSLGVSRDTIFAMLGPNGAGKTTCFNIIRESHVLEYYKFIAVINRPF